MNEAIENKPTMIPFLSPEIEDQLIEKIGTIPKSGIVTVWDPATATAVYVFVKVDVGKFPIMARWTLEGPVSREHAQEAGRKIAEIASQTDDTDPNSLPPITIN